MDVCPGCGTDRIVTLSFQAARSTGPDLERPDVEIMRPIAKCGGCGARIYPNRIAYRGDPSESAPLALLCEQDPSAFTSALDHASGITGSKNVTAETRLR